MPNNFTRFRKTEITMIENKFALFCTRTEFRIQSAFHELSYSARMYFLTVKTARMELHLSIKMEFYIVFEVFMLLTVRGFPASLWLCC